jgi:hypothetical protein
MKTKQGIMITLIGKSMRGKMHTENRGKTGRKSTSYWGKKVGDRYKYCR